MSDVTDEIFDGLMDGFGQIRKHLAGEPDHGLDLHVPDSLDVAAIRQRTGKSQPAFAVSIGVQVDTVRQWEQGRRKPLGPARVLLALIDKDPDIVQRTLGVQSRSVMVHHRR